MKTNTDSGRGHRETIVDQFTRQAAAFAAMPAHSNEEAFQLMFEAAGFSPADTVLDVGCGPGLMACAIAPKVAQVTGIDLTPTMLDKARELQAARGLTNISWHAGDVQSLPFADGAFSCVLTRYTFHHLLQPEAVFAEMARVTAPGGRIMVIDVAPDAAKRAVYDAAEKLRDPSHTKALTAEELASFGAAHGLQPPKVWLYGLEMDLEELLQSSFPEPGNRELLMRRFEADLAKDELGFNTRKVAGKLLIRFPTAIAVWRR